MAPIGVVFPPGRLEHDFHLANIKSFTAESHLTWGGAVLPEIQSWSPRVRQVALERYYLPKLIEEGYATPGKKWYVEESEVTKEKLFEDLGCYCKKVRSVAECPSSKEGKRSDQPERSRWFHGEVATGEKRPHLCCKLAWSAWYNRVFQLCTEELRPLESDVCCRVGEEEQKVGVHIKQAKGLGFQKVGIREWHAKLFGKSRPIFKLSDVTGGTDYDGSPVSAPIELPEKVISKDPKAPEQIEYDWAPGGYQWEAKCLGNQTVSYVTSEKKSKRVRSGTSFRHIGQVPGKSNDDQLQLMDLGALTYHDFRLFARCLAGRRQQAEHITCSRRSPHAFASAVVLRWPHGGDG
eukprot:g23929.t1